MSSNSELDFDAKKSGHNSNALSLLEFSKKYGQHIKQISLEKNTLCVIPTTGDNFVFPNEFNNLNVFVITIAYAKQQLKIYLKEQIKAPCAVGIGPNNTLKVIVPYPPPEDIDFIPDECFGYVIDVVSDNIPARK